MPAKSPQLRAGFDYMNKICPKCKIEKSIDRFTKAKTTDGLSYSCKE